MKVFVVTLSKYRFDFLIVFSGKPATDEMRMDALGLKPNMKVNAYYCLKFKTAC